MQCLFIVDVDVDPSAMPDSEKGKIRWRKNKVAGRETMIPYFPAGTAYNHPTAWKMCRAGNAAPGDEECRAACGMTDEQLAYAQKAYKRNAAGIRPEDFELFDSGVILGYLGNGDYKPGPQWASYMAAKAEAAAKVDPNDI